ncbi:hypothetical protein OH805_15515 [Streptomyces sp. NBC_00879]|uniref:hypothetical protein n=1 Tax=Streptomyces sp. NBC_00879 TaxID=2975855 RepID=UPI00386D79DD|nr:hypothetical protein OH805_15515 [Streptomyces sp. NBC_00879]
MTLGFDDVLHAPLSKMHEAVTDWGQMVTKLEILAEDAGKGMRAKADMADWQGVNADVTKPFIAKTAKEFDDAAKSAKGVKAILDQGYAAFEKAKNDMKKIVDEEAPARKCTVGADGSVRATKPISTTIDEGGKHDPDYDDLVHKEQADIRYIEGRIKSVLDAANEADRDIAQTLKANMGDDRHNFSAPKFDNPDEMHAARAVDLAQKGDKMTDQELKELQGLLHEHSKSPDFTTAFYDKLGPKASLTFFADVAMHTDGDSKERTESLKSLQKDLGFSLATATDPDNKPHLSEKWNTDLRKVGAGSIDLYPDRKANFSPSGYQVLSNILRYGEYDKRFLTPVAEHAAQLAGTEGGDRKPQNRPYIGINLNPAGEDGSYGFNRMTGILEALGHSPEASKDFFDGKMVPYSGDGQVMDKAYFDREVGGGYSKENLDNWNIREGADGKVYLKDLRPGLGMEGHVYTDYFDMFTDKDYEWMDDRSEGFPAVGDDDAQDAWDKASAKAKASGPDALGHALESAVSGRSYEDDSTTSKPVPHTEDQAKLMHRVVERFGSDSGHELIAIKPDNKGGALAPMNDSLGHMTAEYMRDFQKGMAGGSDSIATHGADANLVGLNKGTLLTFLGTVGQDPDAYGAMINAQQATTTDLVNDVARAYDGSKDPDFGDARAEVETHTKPGAIISGVLAEARAEAMYVEKTAGDKDFNDGLKDGAKWADRGFGIISKPLEATGVGAPLAWVVEDIKESVTEHYEHDSAGEGKKAADGYVEDQRESSALAAKEAALTAAKEAGLSHDEQVKMGDTAYAAANDGYDDGRGRKAGYNAPPKTGEK